MQIFFFNPRPFFITSISILFQTTHNTDINQSESMLYLKEIFVSSISREIKRSI